MRSKKLLTIFIVSALFVKNCNAKGGRRGGGSRGGGSKSGSSKASSPSSSSPSNIGNTVNSNTGTNSNSQPASYNPKPSAPVGPPPAYPGLHSEHVSSFNQPPAYSSINNYPHAPPSYYSSNNLPPPYSPGFNARPASSFNYPSNNYKSPSFGSSFGSSGLPANTYISNNYYGSSRSSSISGFLTKALLYGTGLHHGYLWGSGRWNDDDDRRWRATTQAPYFENKVPGADVILPASAVVGAATAFGLISLLPLNVPSQKPLMYCNKNSSEIAQSQIFINGNVYQCINETILVSNFNCLKLTSNENMTTSTESLVSSSELLTNNSVTNSCNEGNKILHCYGDDGIYCVNGTLLSRNDLFCNSTTFVNGTANLNQSIILNCYEGKLAESLVGFIPTTESPTTKKSLSFPAKMHVFLLRAIGKEDVITKARSTTPKQDDSQWIPEALTFPPMTSNTSIFMSNDVDKVNEISSEELSESSQ